MKRIVAVMLLASACGAVGQTAGSFTDPRDGKTYRTVRIGDQTWMAENLNYQTGNSWCSHKRKERPDCNRYGRLYDWNTAMSACPAGWRLPARQDWDDLCQAVGGERNPGNQGIINWAGAGAKLKSQTGWDTTGSAYILGTDDFGFSAMPGGVREDLGKLRGFYNIGLDGYWWSATEYERSAFAYYRNMSYYRDNVSEYWDLKSQGFSVRCLRND